MTVWELTTAVGVQVPVNPETVVTGVVAGTGAWVGNTTVMVDPRAVEIVPVAVNPMS